MIGATRNFERFEVITLFSLISVAETKLARAKQYNIEDNRLCKRMLWYLLLEQVNNWLAARPHTGILLLN